jgi:hypothetical protein
MANAIDNRFVGFPVLDIEIVDRSFDLNALALRCG